MRAISTQRTLRRAGQAKERDAAPQSIVVCVPRAIATDVVSAVCLGACVGSGGN